MHIRASNSELVEPLPEPERTLNRTLHRRNKRVPFEQRNAPHAQPKVVYAPILDINYFCHFFYILENYNLMDDEPMWAVDHVVAPTPGFAITIPETANEFAIKVDKQSGRPSVSLPSNNQANPKGSLSKPYQPLQARNEHVNVVFTRSGISYDPPINLNDQQNNSETPINFDSEDEDDESTPQPKSQTPKPVKETPKPKPYKPKIPNPHCLSKGENEAKNAENMLVEVGKFTFPVDFVILKMEEGSKVPLILGRPFLHIADAVILVKQKQLNLGVEEDFNALLDEGSKILHSIEGTILEEKLFAEFDEFIAMTFEGNSKSESDTEEPPFEKITFNTDYKINTSLEEPPSYLELKPLPDNLEYVFLKEPSFLPIIISSQLSEQNKNIFVLKRHKQAFAWKTTNILGICLSFYKHKIQLLEDKKPVVQKQRRLNLNMQEVVKKKSLNFLTLVLYIQSLTALGQKGIENDVADHLSRIDNDEPSDNSDIEDNFPGETLLGLKRLQGFLELLLL
ncbi:reverse transcriptase domain-containing protein, partial [Tanacetum coccineum]